MGVRPHVCVDSNLGVAADSVVYNGAGTDCAIDEARIGTDLAAIADGCGTLQDGAREERHVLADRHRYIDECLAWVEHCYAVE